MPRSPEELLTAAADLLNARSEPEPHATFFYEMMCGAIRWTDEGVSEGPKGLAIAASWGLRPVLAYRSAAMLGDVAAMETFRPIWEHALRTIPSWVGFRHERCDAKPEYVELLRDRNASWVV